MVTPRSPLGFGTTKQTADFFGLTTAEVLYLAQTGEWRSWLVCGRRLFDLDEIVRQSAQQSRTAADCSEADTIDRPEVSR